MNDDATYRPSLPGTRRTLDIRQLRDKVTGLHAAAMPERVRALVDVEGLGLADFEAFLSKYL